MRKTTIRLIVEVQGGLVVDVRFFNAKDEKQYKLQYEVIDRDISEN